MSAPAKTTGKAAPDNGAAARAETTDEAKTFEFRDVTLKLPAQLPATMLFDLTDLEGLSESPMPVFRLLRSMLGPEQFTTVRHLVADDENVMDSVSSLVDGIFEQYGISLGE